MTESFLTWINNPLLQSMIISPLIGAILGVLLAGLNSPPPANAPTTVKQTTVVFQQIIVVKAGGKPASSTESDIWFYLIATAMLLAGVTWGYSRYAEEILNYWLCGIFSCTFFLLSAGVASAFRRHYTSSGWWWYIFAPIVVSVFAFYLEHVARGKILVGARDAAQNYGVFEFYWNVLKQEHRIWYIFQIAGVISGVIATIATTLRSAHYLALMNQRANGRLHFAWLFLARTTFFSAGVGGAIFILLLAIFAYVSLSGEGFELWNRYAAA